MNWIYSLPTCTSVTHARRHWAILVVALPLLTGSDTPSPATGLAVEAALEGEAKRRAAAESTEKPEKPSSNMGVMMEVLLPGHQWILAYKGEFWGCRAQTACPGLDKALLFEPALGFRFLPERVRYIQRDETMGTCWLDTCDDPEDCGPKSRAPWCQGGQRPEALTPDQVPGT